MFASLFGPWGAPLWAPAAAKSEVRGFGPFSVDGDEVGVKGKGDPRPLPCRGLKKGLPAAPAPIEEAKSNWICCCLMAACHIGLEYNAKRFGFAFDPGGDGSPLSDPGGGIPAVKNGEDTPPGKFGIIFPTCPKEDPVFLLGGESFFEPVLMMECWWMWLWWWLGSWNNPFPTLVANPASLAVGRSSIFWNCRKF